MSKDLTGQRFGKLIVLNLEVASPWVRRRWRCKCDCGNECSRLESTLLNSQRDNTTPSCGCFRRSFLVPGNPELCSKAGSHRKDSFVNGSNVQMTFRNGTISTNTSGCQGVSWSNTAHKWHCYIGYQNYRCNLGFYQDKEDAVKVRHFAEEAIRKDEFEDFYFKLRGYKLGEKQAKQFKK